MGVAWLAFFVERIIRAALSPSKIGIIRSSWIRSNDQLCFTIEAQRLLTKITSKTSSPIVQRITSSPL